MQSSGLFGTSLGTPFESGGVRFGSRDRPQVSGCPAGPSSLGVGYRQPPSREAFLHISLLIRPGTAILWQKTDIRTSAVVFDQKRVFFGLGRLVAVSGRGPASRFAIHKLAWVRHVLVGKAWRLFWLGPAMFWLEKRGVSFGMGQPCFGRKKRGVSFGLLGSSKRLKRFCASRGLATRTATGVGKSWAK